MTDSPILTNLDPEGVLTVTFNRPEKKNAFNTAQWQGLADAINEARENDARGQRQVETHTSTHERWRCPLTPRKPLVLSTLLLRGQVGSLLLSNLAERLKKLRNTHSKKQVSISLNIF